MSKIIDEGNVIVLGTELLINILKFRKKHSLSIGEIKFLLREYIDTIDI